MYFLHGKYLEMGFKGLNRCQEKGSVNQTQLMGPSGISIHQHTEPHWCSL